MNHLVLTTGMALLLSSFHCFSQVEKRPEIIKSSLVMESGFSEPQKQMEQLERLIKEYKTIKAEAENTSAEPNREILYSKVNELKEKIEERIDATAWEPSFDKKDKEAFVRLVATFDEKLSKAFSSSFSE